MPLKGASEGRGKAPNCPELRNFLQKLYQVKKSKGKVKER